MNNILLRMSEGNVMNTTDFALLHENILVNDGIIEGCEMYIIDETTSDARLYISSGKIICHGRVVDVPEQTINLMLGRISESYSGTQGAVYLYLNIDETLESVLYEGKITSYVSDDIYGGLNSMELRLYNIFECGEVEMLLATYTADVDCAYGLQLACDHIKGPYKVVKSDTNIEGYMFEATQRKKDSVLLKNICITPDKWNKSTETGLYSTLLPIGSKYNVMAVNLDINKYGNIRIKSDGAYVYTSIKPAEDIVIPWVLCKDTSQTY